MCAILRAATAPVRHKLSSGDVPLQTQASPCFGDGPAYAPQRCARASQVMIAFNCACGLKVDMSVAGVPFGMYDGMASGCLVAEMGRLWGRGLDFGGAGGGGCNG